MCRIIFVLSLKQQNIICKEIEDKMFNPSMLAAVKSGYYFDEISETKANLWTYLDKYTSDLHLQFFFKYFVTSFSISKLLSKVSTVQTTKPRPYLFLYLNAIYSGVTKIIKHEKQDTYAVST